MSSGNRYPLKDLIRIRKLKLDTAQEQVNKAKSVLKSAQAAVDRQQLRIQQFEKWLPQEEARRFEAIKNKSVNREAVEDIKAHHEALRERLKAHFVRLEEFKKKLIQAEKDLQTARQVYQQISNGLEKIEQHKTAWIANYNKEQDALLEKETEDLRKRTVGFDE
jgi:chromosome segregation ATPase